MMMRKLVWNGGRQFEGLLIEFVVEVGEKDAGREVLSYISPVYDDFFNGFGWVGGMNTKVQSGSCSQKG